MVGVTMVLVEQNIAFGLSLVDTAHLMQTGVVVHSAPVAELDEEICHVEAALPAIRARLVQARMSATRPTGLADDVTALRTRMTILADSLAEAYGVNDPTTPKGA